MHSFQRLLGRLYFFCMELQCAQTLYTWNAKKIFYCRESWKACNIYIKKQNTTQNDDYVFCFGSAGVCLFVTAQPPKRSKNKEEGVRDSWIDDRICCNLMMITVISYSFIKRIIDYCLLLESEQ